MRPFAVRTLAGLVSLVTGCSFIFVSGPPSPPIERAPEVDCTRSNLAPGLDLGIGLATVAVGIMGLAESKPSCGPDQWICLDLSGVAHTTGAILVGVGLLAMGSSVYGFSKTHSCRDVTDAQRECAEGRAEACARLVALPAAAPSSTP